MANRPRPRCPDCGQAMGPVFRKRPRGETFARINDVFWCDTCESLARGRIKKVKYV